MEFRFLVGPEIAEAETHLPPEQCVSWPLDSIVMYCYEGDRVIGRMGVMAIKVIEGTYVVPDAPPTTAFRMMRQLEAMLTYLGSTSALAMVSDETPQIGDYLERVGFNRFPITMYQKFLEEKS